MFEILYDRIVQQPIIATVVITVVLLIIAACSILLIIAISALNDKYINIVKSTSLRYKDILYINSRYCFYNLEEEYIFSKIHKSKAQYDKFSHSKFLEEQIESRIYFFEKIKEEALKNDNLMIEYRDELKNISPFVDKNVFNIKGISFSKYKKIEEKLVSNAILQPVSKPKILIENSYISAKRRNSYHNQRVFSYSEWIYEYDIVCEKRKKKNTKEYQRKIMTDSLRYDIMKRDGFKCVLCGRKAEDGVKLHVDHIIPVSKGGKTIENNLRTLCDSCNLGKSNKYDRYGDN